MQELIRLWRFIKFPTALKTREIAAWKIARLILVLKWMKSAQKKFVKTKCVSKTANLYEKLVKLQYVWKIARVVLALESMNEKRAEKIVKTRCVSKTRKIVFYVLSKIFSYQRRDEHMCPNQELLIDPEMTLIWYSGVRVKRRLCAHISLMANEPKNARNGFQIKAGSGLSSNLNHSFQLVSNIFQI